MLVPRWFIYKRTLSGGIRHSKKPRLPHEAILVDPRKTTIPHIFPSLQSLGYIPPVNLEFENWEYRFWAADFDNDKLTLAECRCCASLFHLKCGRQEHIGQMGCAKKLTAAYKLLLRDRKCLICNFDTKKEKWGVPLCGSACLEAWCGQESQPPALTDALRLVERDA